VENNACSFSPLKKGFGMGLSRAQRKQLTATRELIQCREWADVKHGLVLLEATNDPDLWDIVAAGIRISPEGMLEIGAGEIKKRVRSAHREHVAFFAARQARLLTNLITLDLLYCPSVSETELQSLLSALPSCRIISAVLPGVLDGAGLANTTAAQRTDSPSPEPLSATAPAPADGRSGAMGRTPSPPQMRLTPLRRSR
jgi:hypothetical protein